MSTGQKKITIDELQTGMFVVDLDISWIKSPFLFHRRAIKTKKDIALLKRSGVKQLTIDLDKSQMEIDPAASDAELLRPEQVSGQFIADNEAQNDNVSSEVDGEQPGRREIATPELSADSLNNPTVLLDEEMGRAAILKKQAEQAFNEINDCIEQKKVIPVRKLQPVIDDTISSLLRNSQALLTLMHLKRYEQKLFAHSFSVMTLALTLGIQQELSEDELKELAMAALLHDLGWAQLPLNLFGKPQKYSENEKKVVYQHQKIASVLISKSHHVPDKVRSMMMKHHERLDGSGYPEGLLEQQLDTMDRILILTDYYDETIHGLLDGPGLIPSEALRVFYKEAVQNKLDKLLVESLIKLLGIYPLTSAVELTTGDKGIVVEVNRDKPLIPVVRIMYAADGRPLLNPQLIDLEHDEQKRHIKTIVGEIDETTDPQHLLVNEV